VLGNCPVCQFFEDSLTSAEKLEELSDRCTCTCVTQENDCSSTCRKADYQMLRGSCQRAGVTPLHVACTRTLTNLQVIQFLLENGADVNAVTLKHAHTPLQVSQSVQLSVHVVILSKQLYKLHNYGDSIVICLYGSIYRENSSGVA